MIASVVYDVRYALHQLRKSPVFTMTAVGTLAFGICATTAVFSIVEGLLLQPSPFPQQGNVAILGDEMERTNALSEPTVSAPEISIYERKLRAFSELGAYQTTSYELAGIGEPAMGNASRMEAGTVALLGRAPILGRTFTQQEDQGKQQVALLSYQTWRGRFDGDANVLGQKILLDRKPYEVIGLMPQEFEFSLVPEQLNRSELWVPLSLTPEDLQNQGSWSFRTVGRLNKGVTPALARAYAVRVSKEIKHAIHLALGSQRLSVMQIILTSGAELGLAGCAIGVVVGFLTTRLLRKFLFQVDPLDPTVLALAALSIFVLAILASVIPARRVAMVEPMQALRGE